MTPSPRYRDIHNTDLRTLPKAITVEVYAPDGGYYCAVQGIREMFSTYIVVDGVRCRKVGHAKQFHYVRERV